MYKIIIYGGILFFLVSCTGHYNTSKVSDVFNLIENEYVEDINATKLTDDSIQYMLKHLDAHSVYLNKKDLNKFLISTRGSFGGVGISMHIQNNLLTVTRPINNTPAKAAGIKSGDVIIQINNHSTLGLNIEKCVAMTKGPVGTKLNLTILRKSSTKPLRFSIQRAYINAQPIFSTLIQDNLLYISIPVFNQKTKGELKKILTHYTKVKGIILDLRYNPGGLLDQAVSVIDMFIQKGLIVKQKGRKEQYNTSYYATTSTIDNHTPMVILINEESASASEIVSGTLQIYKRAKIIGQKSFGKGSVQTLFDLGNNSALKMTIAKYYLANGKCIDKIGIIPDIPIKNILHKKKITQSISFKKAKDVIKKLTNHSLLPKYMQSTHKEKDSVYESSFSSSTIQKDKQLLKAIEVLKNNN